MTKCELCPNPMYTKVRLLESDTPDKLVAVCFWCYNKIDVKFAEDEEAYKRHILLARAGEKLL